MVVCVWGGGRCSFVGISTTVAVAQWLVLCAGDPVWTTPSRDWVKDDYSFLPSPHLCRLNARLAFVCAAGTKKFCAR